jgi:electron transfer flavoprotein-quinone oxidoreductase
MMVVGDAAGLCFATGLYLEGINYAIASGRAAAETAVEALRKGDVSAGVLQSYEARLKQCFVLRDFWRYRAAPAFINTERVQNVYPLVVTGIAEQIFRSKGEPKRKLLAIVLRELRRSRVSLWHILRDLWKGGQAFIW